MSDLVQASFDYEALDTQTLIFVKVRSEAIRSRLKRSSEDILAVGQDLLDVKARLPHGQFGRWLRAEFDMTDRQALNFMRVASRFSSKSEIISDLPPTVIYELAAPSTSDAIVDQIESGQIAPNTEAIKKAKEAEKEARAAEAKARADAQATQQSLLFLQQTSKSEIEALTQQIEDLNAEIQTLTTPEVEVREVEKEVVPQSVTNQLEALQKKLDRLTEEAKQHKEASKSQQERIKKLNEELHAAITRGIASENDERIRQQWRLIYGETHACLMRLLGQWPTPLDVQSFDADDWARLDHLKSTLKRVLEECNALRYNEDDLIIEANGSPYALKLYGTQA